MKKLKKMICLILLMMLACVAMIVAADWRVRTFSQPFVAANVADLPAQKVALLLGTTPRLADGRNNLYFDFRIQAAADLYHQGKIRHIIASGDNRKHSYNEPDEMKAALIAKGVPADKITADYAGLRTLDSVLRARDIFGQDEYVIVSQKFHNERAIYLARSHGIVAHGYNARDVNKYAGLKTQIREYLARVKMFVDLWTGKEAKFGGDKIRIPD